MELVSVLEVVVHTEELEQDTIAEAANAAAEADDLKVYTRVRLAFCSKETFLTLFESLILQQHILYSCTTTYQKYKYYNKEL